ncbi:MAG: hypothetical protein LAE24_06855 [Candidatus Contendobacter sp.]|nr:hypothetical protein [Candidatus Contendobacter sp.]
MSPPLAWTGAPSGTVEFAITATTLAVDGKKWNWVLYGIPASVTSLAANTTGIGTTGASTDSPDLKFYPPCSSGSGPRIYTFTLYALSTKPTFSTSPVSGAVLADAIGPVTIGSRQMSVTYTFATLSRTRPQELQPRWTGIDSHHEHTQNRIGTLHGQFLPLPNGGSAAES